MNKINNHWNNDLSFSEKMAVLVDNILQQKIPNIHGINRLKDKNGQVHELDINYAIDGEIIKNTGIRYTFQEKIRRHRYKQYDDFTIEYFSNTKTKKQGEFFHLCADFYLHGYADEPENSISKLRIINVTELKKYIDRNFNSLLKNNLKQNKVHSSASFFTINFSKLEQEGGIILSTIHLDNPTRKRENKSRSTRKNRI